MYNIIKKLDEFKKIKESNNSIIVTGLADIQKRHLASVLSQDKGRPFIFITPNSGKMKEILADIRTFVGKRPELLLTEKRLLNVIKSKDILINKTGLLESFAKGELPNVVSDFNVFFDRFLSVSKYRDMVVKLKQGDKIDFNKLIDIMVELGYESSYTVEGVGQFAVRGGILDFYSPTDETPTRLEFFDDEVDLVRSFDIITQRTIEKKDIGIINPVKDFSDEVSSISIFDYLPKEYLFFVEEPEELSDEKDIIENLISRKSVFLTGIESKLTAFSKASKYSLNGREITSLGGIKAGLTTNLTELIEKKKGIIIFAGNEVTAQNIEKELIKENFTASFIYTLDRLPNVGEVLILKNSLSAGFEYLKTNTVVISSKEITGERIIKPKRKNKKMITNLDELKTGDYIVHDKHGIGVYMGIDTLDAGGVIKDYIKINYAKGDVLYVSVNQLDNITKYIGGEERAPRISKMGGQDWAKVKSKVKSGLYDIAKDLVALYAKRQLQKGFAFSKDTVWQEEFENLFSYEETEDQLRCIDEIKQDMENDLPMDRLLCGDVGYGKTEVAIRAAFKAVMDGKQVVYLAPTTVLVSQHYHSFIERIGEYPIKVESLSRLKTTAEQTKILKELRKGNIDIVIGTHMLLRQGISYKDLGLLIIDEEQKFGVMHKEKIKMIKENVDVLTLTATPIPRTLHMSMVGVKDVSVIYNPPKNRSPVQTYVFEYDREIIKEAIVSELDREGQVYYLYNKVYDIERIVTKLQEDIPWARIAYAHGKLMPKQLEDIMLRFMQHEFDILVCTTIIDSGLDIPNVNTIIIEEAQNLGLSQLYQLRGRVGRSSRLAYAYVTYRKDRVLSEVAQKRLRAIQEFTEFGSGMKIAMRDLEIRGAGSLVGSAQHGHMEAVGYETYCKLLASTIKEIKGEETVLDEDVSIDLDISAYISPKYIANEAQKMEMYKKISFVSNEEDLLDITDELTDRFGDVPKETKRLLNITKIKYLAKKVGISNILVKYNNIVLEFRGQVNIDSILTLIGKQKEKLLFSAGEKPYITLKKYENEDELLKNITFVLQELILLNKDN